MTPYSRRKFLIALGAVGVVALSGCVHQNKPSPKDDLPPHDPRMDVPKDLPEKDSKYVSIVRKEIGEDGIVRAYGFATPPLVFQPGGKPTRKEVLFTESVPLNRISSAMPSGQQFDSIEEALAYKQNVMKQKVGTLFPLQFRSDEERVAFYAMVDEIKEKPPVQVMMPSADGQGSTEETVIILKKETVEEYQRRLNNIERNTVLDKGLFPRRMQDARLTR